MCSRELNRGSSRKEQAMGIQVNIGILLSKRVQKLHGLILV